MIALLVSSALISDDLNAFGYLINLSQADTMQPVVLRIIGVDWALGISFLIYIFYSFSCASGSSFRLFYSESYHKKQLSETAEWV